MGGYNEGDRLIASAVEERAALLAGIPPSRMHSSSLILANALSPRFRYIVVLLAASTSLTLLRREEAAANGNRPGFHSGGSAR
jgi:hypothetical protein